MTKAKAMVLTEFNKPLTMQEFFLPTPKYGEVLVKITAAGVCGSDVHMYQGKDPRTPLPVILGHEGVGKVAAVGGSQKDLFGNSIKEGDEILWNRGVSCGKCYYCLVAKDSSLCENRLVYGITRGCSKPPHLRGCYSQYILLVPNTTILSMPRGMDPAVMVSASCSGATAAHAFDLKPPSLGDTVLVQGPGPLGLYAVAFARAYGAQKIIVVGGTEARLELCQEFGASDLINRKQLNLEERYQKIMKLTGGRGVDYALEAVGTVEAVEEGVKLVRPGGTYLSAGFGEPRGTAQLDCFHDIVRKNLHLQGVWVSDVKHTYMAYQLVLQNPSLFERMVTHRYSLGQANEALESMEKREAVKAVITMDNND